MKPSFGLFVPMTTDEERAIIQVVNFVVLCGLVSLFGVVSNIVNIVVFAKQGFQDSMNISLMGLAVSDLGSVATMLWVSVCFNPLFSQAGLPFNALDIIYMTGGWAHSCFARITAFITGFITFERCLCVALPLKVKMIITPLRTKIVIAFCFLIMFSVFGPFYVANRLTWAFDAKRNATILKITYTADKEIVETVTFFIHSVTFSTFSFVFVICCTIVLVVKLNSKTKWRHATVAKGVSGPEAVGVKDKKVVKMVTFISTIFIVCFVPSTLIFLFMALEPEFSFGGKYKNIFFVVWSFSSVLESVNSSVNILVYLKMSTKYRAVFMKTFLNRERK